jgi:hypothetical protein
MTSKLGKTLQNDTVPLPLTDERLLFITTAMRVKQFHTALASCGGGGGKHIRTATALHAVKELPIISTPPSPPRLPTVLCSMGGTMSLRHTYDDTPLYFIAYVLGNGKLASYVLTGRK